MKNLALTALIALGVGLPSLAAAMNDSQSLHSEKARMIFQQIADESKENE